jgi:two-component system LytT family sensor kinase
MTDEPGSMSPGGPAAVASVVEHTDPIATGRVLVVGAGGALFVALSVTAQTYLSMLGHGHSFWRMLWWQLSVSGPWALFAPIILRLGARTQGPGGTAPRRLVLVTGVGLIAIALHLAFAAVLSIWLQPFVPAIATGFPSALRSQFESQFATDILVFAMLLLIGRTIAVNDRARRLALRESKLEAELARANLEALRLEIQPHFLFNTLNSIAALIRLRANDKALDMLLGLSGLMRATIDRPLEHLTPLAREVAFARQYLDLHAARFGDRLHVQFSIADDCAPLLVPSFLLQPLVENALRHGLAHKSGRGQVAVSAARLGDTLRIRVQDDGVGLAAGFSLARDAGTGLRNINVRLQQLYGTRAALSIAPAGGGGTIVEVTLPADAGDVLARETA